MLKRIHTTNKKIFNQNIRVDFKGKNISSYGGMRLLFDFMKKISLVNNLKNLVRINQHHKCKYTDLQILLCIISGILCGARSINEIERISKDPLISRLLSTKGIDEDTIADRVKMSSLSINTALKKAIWRVSKRIRSRCSTGNEIIDLDSSAVTVYGKQEGAAKGYNPSNKGKASYNPIFAFHAGTRECINGMLRPGNAVSLTDASEFLKETFENLPTNLSNLLVRADAGFFSDEFIQQIEKRPNTNYLIKIRLKNMDNMLNSLEWHDTAERNIKYCTFNYRCSNWAKARKFVNIRLETKTPEKIMGIDYMAKKYEYFSFVTDLDEEPLAIYSKYRDRAICENMIEELKNQANALSIRTRNFDANEMLMICSIIAYNISHWLQIANNPEIDRHLEVKTIRAIYIVVAARLINRSGSLTLVYGRYYIKSHELRKLYEKIVLLYLE